MSSWDRSGSDVRALASTYQRMYALRETENPEAFALPFWENHYVTRTLVGTPGLSGRVLDIGCGTGEIDILLARAKPEVVLYGIDVCRDALEVAHRHLSHESQNVGERIHCCEALLEELPFAEGSFDACVISHTVEHLEHHALLFLELRRVLKPDAPVFIFVPHGHHHDDETHAWHFDEVSLQNHLRMFGHNVSVSMSDDRTQLFASLTLRRRPIVVGMLRVKNEARWLKEVLDKASPVVDGFVVLDDGSTDATGDICRSHPKVIRYEYQTETVVDEVRDKNRLLAWTIALSPDWVLALDGDEILEDAAPETLCREMLAAPPDLTALGVRFLYMWDSETSYRADGLYKDVRHPRVFRARGLPVPPEALHFKGTSHHGNFHCGSVPYNLPGRVQFIDVLVKHFGYQDSGLRERKQAFYTQRDPVTADTGYYRHLTDEDGKNVFPWHERTEAEVILTTDNCTQDLERLKQANNALWQAGLLYLPGSRTHLDIGSNMGKTLIGLDPKNITCVEAYPPAAAVLRSSFGETLEGDAREIIPRLLAEGRRFDRITMYDFIEHIPREDGEKLLKQVEQLSAREIILFVPRETDSIVRSAEYMSYMDEIYKTIPQDQCELQTHRSQWSPDDFRARGYDIWMFNDFHLKGFDAFFAFKYVSETDRELIIRRMHQAAKGPAKPVADARSAAVHDPGTIAFGSFGQGSKMGKPVLISNPGKIFIGSGVIVRDGARLEAVTEYAGTRYDPALIIGDGTSIELSVHIGAAARIRLGKNVMVAGRVSILDHDHGYEDPDKPPLHQPLNVAPVEIEDGVWLGENAVVCKGVRIGKHAVIGANAVVTRDIPPYCVAVGNPARIVKQFNEKTRRWERTTEHGQAEHPTAPAVDHRSLYALAHRLLERNEQQDARIVLEALAALLPDSSEVHNDLGVLCFQLGEQEEGIKFLERAVDLNSANIESLRNLGDAYASLGRAQDARKAFERILVQRPDDPEALDALGATAVEQQVRAHDNRKQEPAQHSEEARPDLARYQALYPDIEGWLDWTAVNILDFANKIQLAEGISGDIFEIGVYKGKLTMLLATFLRKEGEKLRVCDIFDNQNLGSLGKASGYFKGDTFNGYDASLAAFVNNFRKLYPWAPFLEIIPGNSNGLTVANTGDNVRLFSIDGGHSTLDTYNDMVIASRALNRNGIIILDDFYNAEWPEVEKGAALYFSKHPDLAPLLYGYNKFLFVRNDVHGHYRELLEKYGLETFCREHDLTKTESTLFGHSFFQVQ